MAKIVEVRASAHSCPFDTNLVRLGLGTNTKRDIVLVRIVDESGAVGPRRGSSRPEPHRHGSGDSGRARLAHRRRRPPRRRGHLASARAPADRHPRARRRQHHGARGHRQRALGPQGQAARAADLHASRRCQEANSRIRRRLKPWLQTSGRFRKRGRSACRRRLHGDQDARRRSPGAGRHAREPHPQDLRRRSRHRRRCRDALRPARYPGRAALLRGESGVLAGGAVHAGQHPGLCGTSHAHRDSHRRRREPLR